VGYQSKRVAHKERRGVGGWKCLKKPKKGIILHLTRFKGWGATNKSKYGMAVKLWDYIYGATLSIMQRMETPGNNPSWGYCPCHFVGPQKGSKKAWITLEKV